MKLLFTLRSPILMLFLVPLCSLLLSSCDDDDDGAPPRPTENLIEVITANEGLDSLAALIVAPGPNNALASRLTNQEHTVFAPSNAAFQRLLNSIGLQNLVELRGDILSDILLYHVVPNTTFMPDEQDSALTTLTTSQIIASTVGDSVVLNADTQPGTVVTNSLDAANGVVHITNNVLLPPGISNLAPLFGTLAGLTNTLGDIFRIQNFDGGISSISNVFNITDLTTTLAGTETYTVLAPVNSSFNNFFFTTVENRLETARNHLLAGNVNLSTANRTITTLSGETVYVTNLDGVVFLNGRQTVDADYVANNGRLVHMVGVLKPAEPLEDMLDYIAAFGINLNVFRRALELSGLEVGSNRTIFLPTDEAFAEAGFVTSIDSVEAQAQTARIDPAVLSSILQNHIVGETLFEVDIEEGAVNTLNGSVQVTFEGNNNITTLNDNNPATEENAEVIFSDHLVENGVVIHVIDQVLLPN